MVDTLNMTLIVKEAFRRKFGKDWEIALYVLDIKYDKTKSAILNIIRKSKKPLTVGEVNIRLEKKRIKLSYVNTHRHLRNMEKKGLVVFEHPGEHQGKKNYVSLNNMHIKIVEKVLSFEIEVDIRFKFNEKK